MGVTYDKLRAVGISDGLKPVGQEAIDAGPILYASGIPAKSACLLQAWLGGAHDATDEGISYQLFGATIGVEGSSFMAYELSAQYACGVPDTWFSWSLPKISDALADLRKVDERAAELVESAGKAKAKANYKQQTQAAQEDSERLRERALSAVSVGAIGVGTVAAVVAVAYLLFLASTAKGK